jgi:predicted nucleic acid-binding protein
MAKKPKVLLMDANVLIDYQKSDFSVLGLVSKHVGEVHVLTNIIEEVDDLEVDDCERIGLKAIEPELNQLTQAAAKRGQLSFRDHLCLLVASEAGFVCVTNDKPLRRACTEEGVSILWGLEIMTALVRANAISATDAIQTAEKIHLSNPLHIPRKLVDQFAKIVTDIEKKRSGK